MATIKDLKTLVGDGLLAFEHGFNGPYISGKKVWGIDTQKQIVYCCGIKMPFDKLDNIQINILYKKAYEYIYKFQF